MTGTQYPGPGHHLINMGCWGAFEMARPQHRRRARPGAYPKAMEFPYLAGAGLGTGDGMTADRGGTSPTSNSPFMPRAV
jgi:hypothetical protein